MDATGDQFAIAQVGRDTCVVAASGELDRTAAAHLEDALQTARDSAALSLIVDLTAVTFLDAAMLAVLAGAAARRRPDGGDVVVVTRDPRLERVFEITGIAGLLRVEHSLQEAVNGRVAHVV